MLRLTPHQLETTQDPYSLLVVCQARSTFLSWNARGRTCYLPGVWRITCQSVTPRQASLDGVPLESLYQHWCLPNHILPSTYRYRRHSGWAGASSGGLTGISDATQDRRLFHGTYSIRFEIVANRLRCAICAVREYQDVSPTIGRPATQLYELGAGLCSLLRLRGVGRGGETHSGRSRWGARR